MLSRELSSPQLDADGNISTNLSMFARAIHEVVRLSVHYYTGKTVTLEIHDVILVSM
jgi:hypothetical protein